MSVDAGASVAPTQATPASREPQNSQNRLGRWRTFAGDIKIAHTVFAMPFALLSAFLAANGFPGILKLSLILICMAAARTLAMSSNRLLDAALDAQNPRTANRALPRGDLTANFYRAIVLFCAIVFIASTAMFGLRYQNWLPLILSVPVLAFVASYPLLKRFSKLAHYYLGASLALAPVCACIAIAGRVSVDSLLLGAAVLCWTAGFDIIYACQDFDHDRAAGLFSIPAKLGIGPALWVSRLTHIVALAMLVALGLHDSPQLSILYFVGVWISAGLLVVEHLLVSPNDLSRVGIAFFLLNGIISLVLGTLGILDVFY